MPAGNHFDYVNAPRDALGRPREFPAELIQGSERRATELLLALAPRGVRPPRWPGSEPRQPASEWIRHNQRHHYHLMPCFHEPHFAISPLLPRIITALENLILVGLPRYALHFTWHLHRKAYGSHPHGSLPAVLLTDGRPAL